MFSFKRLYLNNDDLLKLLAFDCITKFPKASNRSTFGFVLLVLVNIKLALPLVSKFRFLVILNFTPNLLEKLMVLLILFPFCPVNNGLFI
jgi:hypothetical protein